MAHGRAAAGRDEVTPRCHLCSGPTVRAGANLAACTQCDRLLPF